jgi:hypothetical protein
MLIRLDAQATGASLRFAHHLPQFVESSEVELIIVGMCVLAPAQHMGTSPCCSLLS